MHRSWAPCVAIVAACGLAACADSISGGPNASGVSLPKAASLHSNAVIVSNGSQLTVTGPITAKSASGFTMQEGTGAGFAHVIVSAQTTVAGPAPFVGENVAVSGSGVPGGQLTATSVAEQVVLPTGILALTGPISNTSANLFTVLAPGYGHTHVTTNASTQFVGGRPQNGMYAQAIGPGSTSETAEYVSIWTGAPPALTVPGTVVAPTALGFTLSVDANHTAVPIVLSSSTALSKWPVVVGGTAVVTGRGSIDRSIVAASIAVPSPTPVPTSTPNPNATPTPKPIVLTQGGVIGQPGLFTPPHGDMQFGGQGQTVDGIPCAPTMTENLYHVHWYLGLLVNGKQVAIPDTIGMLDPAAPVNGFTASAQCYYEIHTHDASGMIHVESPSAAALSSTVYNVGTLFDVWGISVGPNNVGPFTGQVRVFLDRVPLKSPVAASYTEYLNAPGTIPIYSHEAVWLEVGPTFVVPPNIPAVDFYTEY